MKIAFTLFFLCLLAAWTPAQMPDEILATATGLTFNHSSLSDNARKVYLGRDKIVGNERLSLLSEMIMETLLNSEAKARGTTSEAIIAAELKKAGTPAET